MQLEHFEWKQYLMARDNTKRLFSSFIQADSISHRANTVTECCLDKILYLELQILVRKVFNFNKARECIEYALNGRTSLARKQQMNPVCYIIFIQ